MHVFGDRKPVGPGERCACGHHLGEAREVGDAQVREDEINENTGGGLLHEYYRAAV